MIIVLFIASIFGIRALVRAAKQTPRMVYVEQETASDGISIADLNRRNKEAQKRTEQKMKAYADIPHLKQQIGNLYALLEIAEAEYAATNNVQRQARFLRQINSLENQIHNAESKLIKARAILAQ